MPKHPPLTSAAEAITAIDLRLVTNMSQGSYLRTYVDEGAADTLRENSLLFTAVRAYLDAQSNQVTALPNFRKGDEKLVHRARKLTRKGKKSDKDDLLISLAASVERMSADLYGGTAEGDKGLIREHRFAEEVLRYRMDDLTETQTKLDTIVTLHAPWAELTAEQRSARLDRVIPLIITVLRRSPHPTPVRTVMVRVGIRAHLPAQEIEPGILEAETRKLISINRKKRTIRLLPAPKRRSAA